MIYVYLKMSGSISSSANSISGVSVEENNTNAYPNKHAYIFCHVPYAGLFDNRRISHGSRIGVRLYILTY